MLTYTAPTTVRPIPEEATGQRHGRTPGAVGLILDGDVLAEWMQNEGLTDGRDVHVGELLLLASPHGEVGIIGAEGVGVKRDAESETFPVPVAIGFMWTDVEFPAHIIEKAKTTEGADVAGFIRLFGDRLDGNAYSWRRFVTGGTF